MRRPSKQRIAAARFESTQTRARVRAETLEAARLGLIPFGDVPMPMATLEQAEHIRLAGLRALDTDRTLASR